MSFEMLVVVLLGVVIFLVAGILVVKFVPKRTKKSTFQTKWKDVINYCKDKETWPTALTRADELLDMALQRRRYKGKNIHEVLEMTVEDALPFFAPVTAIARKLQTLVDVGLSYIRLGQAATTLSGGEAQRVKLSRELSKRDTGKTLYILDEPTTGLHFEDIKQLLEVLHRLRDHGNTVVIIEHNLDVIKTADWIVDLGPEGGSGGGRIIATGTPEDVAKTKGSYTGQFLMPVLKKRNRRKAA